MFFADSGDNYISVFCMCSEIFCSTMTYGDRGSRMEEQQGERFPHDSALADDNHMLAFNSQRWMCVSWQMSGSWSFFEVILNYFHDPFWSSWYEP